jgi:hypothetical protein
MASGFGKTSTSRSEHPVDNFRSIHEDRLGVEHANQFDYASVRANSLGTANSWNPAMRSAQ